MVLAVWYSNLLGVGTLSQWLPKQMNVLRTKAQSITSTQSWKNSKLKQVVHLGWAFLANKVWECTKVHHYCVLSPVLSQNQKLGTSPLHVSTLLHLFNNDVTPSHPCHQHVMMQSFGNIMLFWQENHVHQFRCTSSNPLLRACPLVQPYSNYFYRIRDSDPGHTPWHSPPGTLVHPHIELARIMIY